MEKELFMLMGQYPKAKVRFDLYNPESRFNYEGLMIEEVLLETEYIEGVAVSHEIVVTLKEKW